jgi:hypothetical protein
MHGQQNTKTHSNALTVGNTFQPSSSGSERQTCTPISESLHFQPPNIPYFIVANSRISVCELGKMRKEDVVGKSEVQTGQQSVRRRQDGQCS